MNTEFHFSARAAKRLVSLVLAAFLVIASAPMFQPGHAAAAPTQVSNRSIELSDASPSGTTITTGVGSGTNVKYELKFTPATQAGSIVIDFCQNDPILADPCTAPSAMNASTATITNVAGTLCGTGWTITASATQIKLADDASTHDILPSTVQTCDISGITNTSTVGTFYARMYTYAGTGWGTYASVTNLGNYVDYGGMAMSITPAITITARVQETLTFCVTTKDPGVAGAGWTAPNDCSSADIAANPPNLTLGHGSPTQILDTSAVDRADVYTQLSTNATHGATVRMRNSNLLCGGLSADGGATCAIPGVGSVAGNSNTAPAAITQGTAAFGVFVSNGYAGLNAANETNDLANTNYNDNIHTTSPGYFYGMDDSGTGVTSQYGDSIVNVSSPVYHAQNHLVFGATAALTTPAGIYTANLSLICTGQF
jgi:hypothetical protein